MNHDETDRWAVFQVLYQDGTSSYQVMSSTCGVLEDVVFYWHADKLIALLNNGRELTLIRPSEGLKMDHMYVWSLWIDKHRRTHQVKSVVDLTEEYEND